MAPTRTHIVCTIGPASRAPSRLEALVRAGMTAARLNFSHGTHAEHAELFRRVRAAARRAGGTVAVLADLQGPKIRLGVLPEAGIPVKAGTIVTFTTGTACGGKIPVTYPQLHRDVKPGHRLLIEDGLYELRVAAVHGRDIRAKVVNGGRLFSHKGMNFPDSRLRVPALTEKDADDAAFAVKMGADWIALSFVTSPADVRALRRLLKRSAGGQSPPRIMVKIEKHEALEAFDDILAEADGAMVARGDLGVEIPPEDVPEWQKRLVARCRAAGKPVVVATQMLDSMIRHPRPTRAEVSDVANAVFDHADATMLSGETATGAYPVQAAAMMARIIREAEASPFDDFSPPPPRPREPVETNVARALKLLADDRHIAGVLAFQALAPWSERLHLFHPEVPLFLAVPDEEEARRQALRWGVRPFVCAAASCRSGSREAILHRALAWLKRRRWVHAGDHLAVVLGVEHGKGFDLVDVP